MRLVFVGSGGKGVPFIGVQPPAGATLDPNWRMSVAHALQPNFPDPGTILIDAGPDIMNQWAMWRDAPFQPDAVILSHSHFDHMGGICFFKHCKPTMPTYGTAETLDRIRLFAAAVWPEAEMFGLDARELPWRGETAICGISVETVPVHHSPVMPSIGLLIRHRGRFLVHLADTAANIEDDVRAAIRGCDTLVVNTPFVENTYSHIGVSGAVALAREVGAKRLVLAHITYVVPPVQLREIEAAHDWVTVARDGTIVDV